MKRAFHIFIIFWVGLFIVSFFTAKTELSLLQRLSYTAVMAGFAALLSAGGKNSTKSNSPRSKSRQIRVVEIRVPNSPKVLYQIKRSKVYRNLEAAPIYEIKDYKVYRVNSPKVIYTLQDNKVYRNMEPVPILEIRGDKICRPLSPKVVYQMYVRYE